MLIELFLEQQNAVLLSPGPFTIQSLGQIRIVCNCPATSRKNGILGSPQAVPGQGLLLFLVLVSFLV